MEIKFLGTGGAFEPAYYNAAAILKLREKSFLIDAGFTVYPRLVQLNLLFSFDYILLTHLHNDHCGSLANILLHRYFYGDGRKTVILYQTEDFKTQMQEFLRIQLKDPDKYADFVACDTVSNLTILDTYGRHAENFQSYGLIWEEADKRLVYSGDLQQTDFLFAHLLPLPPMPTIIFHDISFNPENKGHTHYTRLQPYQSQYTIFGYHCDPTQSPADNTIPLVYNQPEYMF